MPTTFKLSSPNPVTAVVTMTREDSRPAYVWCSVPGGEPRFSFGDPTVAGSDYGTAVVGAPTMDSGRALLAFAKERFSDDA